MDVALDGALPRGARPDLTVDGTIELERLADVLYVGRPAQGQPESAVHASSAWRPTARTPARVPVKLGRASVSAIEILEGLPPATRSSSPTPPPGTSPTASASTSASHETSEE